MRVWMYTSTFLSTRHYLEVNSKLYAPAALPLVLITQEASWALAPVWTPWRSDNWPNGDLNSGPSVAQPVVSRYTDYAKYMKG
jgi:hypothetical protein